MIEAREQFLDGRADIAAHLPNAHSPPDGEQPKLRPGTPIGPTRVPEEPEIAWMRSFEQSSENQQQALVPGGATFTPYWQPHGVSEADLYG